MSWPIVQLQDLALQEKGAIVSGPFGSNIGSRFFVEQGVPVIRGNNLTKGYKKFIDDGFVYLTDSKAAEFPNLNYSRQIKKEGRKYVKIVLLHHYLSTQEPSL